MQISLLVAMSLPLCVTARCRGGRSRSSSGSVVMHPQPAFFIECEIPSFTHIEVIVFLSFNLKIFRQRPKRRKVLNCVIATFPDLNVFISS
jgi:hypothetical protein